MKLSIVSPQFPFSGRVPLVPPILEYLAALTMREKPETEIRLIDANQRTISADDISTDYVAISVMTATAPWAYRFADECRAIGKRVILGGIHPTALPDEAALHADAVVTGEAESVWGRVLADMSRDRMNMFYHGERLPLDDLPKPIDGKLKGNYQFRAFFTMRGCPHRCTFCSVRKFFGDTIRYRPISEVVDEIETHAGKLWFNGDDNIWGGDVQRSIALFKALAQGTKRHWYGFGDLRTIQGPQGARMLAAARESGLFSVWSGWESDEQHLGAFKAGGKQGADRVAAVKRMQEAGIDVTLFVVLGGRQDSIDSFKRTLELSERLSVGIHPVLLTPLPGTELYDEYRKHLLPGLGWEYFTGVRAVYEHPSPEMTPVRRELEYHHLNQELFRFNSIIRRIVSLPWTVFPKIHLLSFMMQMPMKLAFSKAYDEWKSKLQNYAKDKTPSRNSIEASASSWWSEVKWRAGLVRGRMPRSFSLKIYGICLVAVTLIHILHGVEPGVSTSLDRVNLALHLMEVFIFWVLVSLGALAIIARQRNIAKWITAIGFIASDKINRWAILLKELAYSSMIGAGAYWAYVCMAEL